MKRDLKKIVNQMTLEEKAGMCSGLDFWHLKHVERLRSKEQALKAAGGKQTALMLSFIPR